MTLPTPPYPINTSLLRPVLSLAAWTFAMEIWLYATRIPAFSKYKINLKNPSRAKAEMEAKFPPHVTNVAANFAHLHEQPTVFYAVVLALAVAGDASLGTQYAAWGYVGLRVTHSFYQSLVNDPVIRRFYLFALSSLVLAGLTARAALLVF